MSLSVFIAKELFFITLMVSIAGYCFNKYSNNIVISDKNTSPTRATQQFGPFKFSYN